MKLICLMGLALFICLPSSTFGQNTEPYIYSGTVKDMATGESLPGVIVTLEGGLETQVSDINGEFEIRSAKEQATLMFKLLGYLSKKVIVVPSKDLQIGLETDLENLGTAVITALGIKREEQDLGYAVQKLGARDINQVQSPNFVDNIAGKVAGVTISQGATGVGSTSKISIRGEASFSSNNPLFVVDGTPINNNSLVNVTNDAAAGFQEVDFGNGAMEVNPDDVASITVLKGPSAAALYGTRASNGVILITTKKGSRKEGFGVSFNSSIMVDRAFQLPRFQNEYGQGNSGEFAFGDGSGLGTNDNITYSWGPQLNAGLEIAQFNSPVADSDGNLLISPSGTIIRAGDTGLYDVNDTSLTRVGLPFLSQPNNLRDFYNTGFTLTNNLAVSNSFDKGSIRFSYTDMNSQSIIPGVNLDRNTASLRLHLQTDPRLSINSTVSYINSRSDNRPSGGYGSENINYSLVAWGPRSLDIGELQNYWQPGLENLQQYSFNYTFFDNPYFILKENRNGFNRDRLFGNVSARYQVSDQLSVLLRTGMDYSSELRTFRRAFSTNRFANGAYAEHDVFFRENNTDLLVHYKAKTSRIQFDFFAGANQMDQKASTQQIQALSLAQPGIFQLSNAASPIEAFTFESQKRINSIYGIAKVDWERKVIVEITARNDWSSALATPAPSDNVNLNQSTALFYPSLSASFVLSEMINLPSFISFAKLRSNIAQVGNDTGPYQTSSVFNAQTPFQGEATFSDNATIANSSLLAETTTSWELGADMRFFSDRARIDVTYYNATTSDQIIAAPIPISSGFDNQIVNGGKVVSKGWEAILDITVVDQEDFQWNSLFNFSRNVTTVEELPDGVETLTLAYSRVYDNVNQTVWYQVSQGGRIGDMYGTGYERAPDGQFLISEEGNYIPNNELQLLGNYNPDFILAWNNQFSFQQWDASFLFDWRYGGVLVSRTRALAGVGGQLAETANRPEAVVLEGVQNIGTETAPQYIPNDVAILAETAYRSYYDRNHEENNTYDASYLKLRQFAIGYTFGNQRGNGFFQDGRKLRISLIGRNLFALSEIPHFDPEQLAVQGQQFVSGVEDMSYASSRSIGVKFGFQF